jgi:hypothetical protein
VSAGLAGSAAPSSTTARRIPPRPAPRRTSLRLVPAPPPSVPRTRFIALVATLLVTGLLGLLMLNTVLARNAFALHGLSVETRTLGDTEQSLQREVERLRSPENLATRATELGMVQAGPPAFLRLSDGAVLGATEPAAAPVAAVPTPAAVKPSPAATRPSPAAPKASPAATRPSPAATKASPVATKPSAAATKPSAAAVKPSPAARTSTAPRTGATPAPGAAR